MVDPNLGVHRAGPKLALGLDGSQVHRAQGTLVGVVEPNLGVHGAGPNGRRIGAGGWTPQPQRQPDDRSQDEREDYKRAENARQPGYHERRFHERVNAEFPPTNGGIGRARALRGSMPELQPRASGRVSDEGLRSSAGRAQGGLREESRRPALGPGARGGTPATRAADTAPARQARATRAEAPRPLASAHGGSARPEAGSRRRRKADASNAAIRRPPCGNNKWTRAHSPGDGNKRGPRTLPRDRRSARIRRHTRATAPARPASPRRRQGQSDRFCPGCRTFVGPTETRERSRP
jgi:hypothetical protein